MKTPFRTLTVATVLFATINSPADARGKPGGGDTGISNPAFAYEESGAIYVTTIDGSQTLKLTNPKRRTDDCCPSWSPDLDPGKPGYQGKIAYLNHYEPGLIVSDLFVMNPDGTDKQFVKRFSDFPIPDEVHTTSLTWSPNGREIIFSSLGDRLHAVNVATGDVRVVMERVFPFSQIVWPQVSPLGMLSFLSDGDVYVVDSWLDQDGMLQVDAPSATVVVSAGDEFSIIRRFTWSPDGTCIGYIRVTDDPAGDDTQQLAVYDLAFDEFTLLLQEPEPRLVTARPTWSPDGSQIAIHAWVTESNGKEGWDIVRITNWADPDTREFINVTRTDRANEGWPVWNPGWQSP